MTYSRTLFALVISALISIGACAPEVPDQPVADSIFYNGAVYTVDSDSSWAEALAVSDGQFIAVGSNDDVLMHKGPGTDLVDLEGKMVMPGIHDGHLHLMLAGLANKRWCLLPDGDWEAAQNKLKRWAGETPVNEWLIAFPYQPEWFDNGVDKNRLDGAVPEHPLYMIRWDGHVAAVNSVGMAIATGGGIAELFAGGRLIYDDEGQPTGELLEGATWLASQHLPPYREEHIEEAVLWSMRTANRYGVVSVQEASATAPLLRALNNLDERDQLTLHVAAHIVWWNENFGEATKTDMNTLSDRRENYRSGHVDVSFAKLWIDGTPVPPNESIVDVDETGTPRYEQAFIDQETLNDALIDFDRKGVQVKMHAASVGGTKMALNAIAATRRARPESTLLHQLGHSSDIAPSDRDRVVDLRATADFSPAVWGWYPDSDDFPMRDLTDSGAIATLGSDWPFPVVAHNNPFPPLADALERTRQGVDIETGIRMLTINGAIAVGTADRAGSIEVGKSADFVVLDRNIVTSSPDRVRATRVMRTVFEGKTVHQMHPTD